MSVPQIASTIVLVVGLLVLAGYYAWRQWQTLRRLREDEDLPDEDRRFLRNQAWRRLAGSGLMVLFAVLLAGSFTFEDQAQELADRSASARAESREPELTDADRRFRSLYAIYWIFLLLGVLAILGLAGYDFWATRRYGIRFYRKLQAERREMIAREIALLRRDRNGHT